jgi:DinB superfamily
MTLPATTLTATSSTATASTRPQPGDYAPYYDRYISLVRHNETPAGDILAALEDQRRQMLLLLSGRTEADGELRYAPDKWSLKEVLGHVNDTERIMSYRALRISRGDATPIEGYEQDDYVRNGPFARRQLADLIEEYIAVRRATVSLFRNLDEAAWSRRGVANKNEVTVRALAYIIAGHELHHRGIIEEKYLK